MMIVQVNRKKGRPTKQQQAEIVEKLQQYHKKNYSSTLTSRETKINSKTVSKYFNKWDTELLESNNDFLTRCKVEREKTIITVEKEIESLNRQEGIVDNFLEKCVESGDLQNFVKLSKLKLQTKETKQKFLATKMNLVGTPTYDTILKLSSRETSNGSNR